MGSSHPIAYKMRAINYLRELFDRIEELEEEKRILEQQVSDLEGENSFLQSQLDDKEY